MRPQWRNKAAEEADTRTEGGRDDTVEIDDRRPRRRRARKPRGEYAKTGAKRDGDPGCRPRGVRRVRLSLRLLRDVAQQGRHERGRPAASLPQQERAAGGRARPPRPVLARTRPTRRPGGRRPRSAVSWSSPPTTPPFPASSSSTASSRPRPIARTIPPTSTSSGRYEFTRSNLRTAFESSSEMDDSWPGVTPQSAAVATIAMMDGLQVQWLLDREVVDMAEELGARSSRASSTSTSTRPPSTRRRSLSSRPAPQRPDGAAEDEGPPGTAITGMRRPHGVGRSMTTFGIIGADIGTTSRRASSARARRRDRQLTGAGDPRGARRGARAEGPGGDAAEAAAAGELSGDRAAQGARDMPVEPLAGKIVLDTNNYYWERDGRIAELDRRRGDHLGPAAGAPPTSRWSRRFNHIVAADITTDGIPAGNRTARPGHLQRLPGSGRLRHRALRRDRLRHRQRRPARASAGASSATGPPTSSSRMPAELKGNLANETR